MVKTRGPLLGLAASGSIGSTITFSCNKGRSYVKKKSSPKKVSTTNSTSAKQLFGFLGGVGWASLTPTQQQLWQTIAFEKSTTPLNEFIREGMTHLIGAGGPTQEPGQTAGGTQAFPPGLSTVVGGVGQIEITYGLILVNNAWFELPLLNCPTVAGGATLTFPWWITTGPTGIKKHVIKNVPAGTYGVSIFKGTTTGLIVTRGTVLGVTVT